MGSVAAAKHVKRYVISSGRGFTLLEVVVVLAIVGLLTGIALPQLQRLARSVEISNQREALLTAVAGLGYRAYASSSPVVLDGSLRREGPSGSQVPSLIGLPAGWELRVAAPVLYSSNGVCGGGRLTVADPEGRVEHFILRPPHCRPDRIEAP